MNNHTFDPEITTLVRRFSEKVAQEMPNDTIAQALGTWEEEEKARESKDAAWQIFLQFTETSDPESELLEQQCRKVAEIWREFKSHSKGLEWTDGIDKPPSIMVLQEQVLSTQNKFETRNEHGWGRAKNNFLSFVESLEGHKALFSAIPSGNMYTSLLVGVVSSVVKASVEYGRAVEGFSQALADLSSDIQFVRKSTRISGSPEMKKSVINLYVEVFDFLCHAMKWYQSPGKRLLKSFNTRFYDDNVKKKVTKIQRLVKQTTREANLMTQLRVMDLAETQRSFGEEVRIQMEQVIGRQFDNFRDRLFSELGNSSANLLKAQGEATKDEEQKAVIMGSRYTRAGYAEPYSQDNRETSQTNSASTYQEAIIQTRQAIFEYSHHLKDFAKYLPIQPSVASDTLSPLAIREEVGQALRLWIESQGTRFLWIEGPVDDSPNVDLFRMTVKVCNEATAARIPVVLFFRRSGYHFQTGAMSSQNAGMIALLYSLIMQFINLLPESFQSTPILSRETFRCLNGSLSSVDTALEILDNLMALAPPALVCVIEGVGRLENSETMIPIAKLVNMLRSHGQGRRLKVLFTTFGASYVLGRKMDIQERVQTTRMTRPGLYPSGVASASNAMMGRMR